jgi:peptidoglycan/LPS O-acetylase OafA/YrhL
VAGVLAFHAGFGWASGGYLGVSTFFTLSGFLITKILVAEWESRGRIDLVHFWTRRARRLMPAAFVGLMIIALFGAFAADPVQLARLRSDGLGALLYVANWRLLYSGQSYAELFS